MLDLIATEACSPGKLSDLMQRALNYLHTFWKQLFAYRNDGEYMIDNLVARAHDQEYDDTAQEQPVLLQ